MRAVVTPAGRDPLELVLTGEPEYSESARGGYTVATVPCRIPERHRDRLLDARIRLFPAHGVPWIGRVSHIAQDGKTGALMCGGPQHDLSRFVRDAWYCHTATGDWQERTISTRATNAIPFTLSGPRLILTTQGAVATDDFNGCYLRLPSTTGSTVAFAWKRHSTAWSIKLYWGTWAPDANGHETGGSWTGNTTIAPAGSGITTGDASHAITDAHDVVLVEYQYHGGGTSIAQTNVIADVKVYGVAGVTTVTGPNVIGNVCDQLPSWVLPAGAQYRHWISTDATTIEPLVFTGASELDIIEEVLSYRDYDFGFRARLVDDAYHAVPVYEARPTEASYQAHLGERVTGEITAEDITAMCSAVRVDYQDSDGRARSLTVTETSEDNYLVSVGQAKTDVIRADTASATTAALMGQRYLDARRVRRVAGTVEVAGLITDMRGASVWPCEIEAGKVIRLHNTPYGSVDARITDVLKRGDVWAQLTLDSRPTALDTELAMLTKRTGAR